MPNSLFFFNKLTPSCFPKVTNESFYLFIIIMIEFKPFQLGVVVVVLAMLHSLLGSQLLNKGLNLGHFSESPES